MPRPEALPVEVVEHRSRICGACQIFVEAAPAVLRERRLAQPRARICPRRGCGALTGNTRSRETVYSASDTWVPTLPSHPPTIPTILATTGARASPIMPMARADAMA